MSTLIFTENKLLRWCFAKLRSYLILKRLVKVLKLRISCFKVIPVSGCFRQLFTNSLGKSFLLLRVLFIWKQMHLKFLYLRGSTGRKIAFHLAKIDIFSTSSAHPGSYRYCIFLEEVKLHKNKSCT